MDFDVVTVNYINQDEKHTFTGTLSECQQYLSSQSPSVEGVIKQIMREKQDALFDQSTGLYVGSGQVVAYNNFMLAPSQVVCPRCGWQGIDEDCIRVPDSFVECPKCREQVHLLVEDDPVVIPSNDAGTDSTSIPLAEIS